MKLIVAADDNQTAQGSLFWDDKETKDNLDKHYIGKSLVNTNELRLGFINIWGV